MGMDDPIDLREALKRVAVALKRTGVPFALTGGYAAWARGGPEPDHDVDFLVAQEDAVEVAARLADQDLDVVQPPEDWLFKVYDEGAMVDIIHRPVGGPVHREDLLRATPMDVLSVEMPVLAATDIVVHKLNALDEHYCDVSVLLPVMRALREQVDWPRVDKETADNDFAVAVIFLLRRLSIVGEEQESRLTP
jgi:hypothetical protein